MRWGIHVSISKGIRSGYVIYNSICILLHCCIQLHQYNTNTSKFKDRLYMCQIMLCMCITHWDIMKLVICPLHIFLSVQTCLMRKGGSHSTVIGRWGYRQIGWGFYVAPGYDSYQNASHSPRLSHAYLGFTVKQPFLKYHETSFHLFHDSQD